MRKSEKLHFFGNLLKTCNNLFLFLTDSDFEPVRSNCPDEDSAYIFLPVEETRDQIESAYQKGRRPLILTTSSGIMWTIGFGADISGMPQRICFLGPYMIDDAAHSSASAALDIMDLSDQEKSETRKFLRSIPVISLNKAIENSIMLHFTLQEEMISVSDLRYIDQKESVKHIPDQTEENLMVHGTYAREQEMIRMVKDGDLNISKKISSMLTSGTVGRLADSPNRQLKNMVLVGIVLFSRAAIEGGLSPELSMSLCDRYFQGVESAKNISELTEINRTMQNDYVQRVHEIKEHSDLSAAVRAVNAYIDIHLEEPIHLSEMASSLGYSTYYLSRKYQKETGITISTRIRQRRIAVAKELLADSTLPVADISERLCFSSPSYFIEKFRNECGVTPAEYRNSKGQLI